MKGRVGKRFRIFGLNGSKDYAQKVADHLGVPLGKVREKHFSDGEVLAYPNENVRNCNCYFIFDPHTDSKLTVNDKMMMTFIFIQALRKASARSVTWIKRPPAYDRQDRKTKPREPVTTQIMGSIYDSLFLNRLITLDPHSLVATSNNQRWGNTDVLQARKVLADDIVRYIDDPDKLVIQAPDEGAVNRHVKPARRSLEKRLTEKFGRPIRIPMTYFDKEHASEQEEVTGDLIIGNVEGKDVLVWDDMFGTGGTIRQNNQAIQKRGGRLRYVVATHGYFTPKYDEDNKIWNTADLNFEGIEHIFITDSMDMQRPWRLTPQFLGSLSPAMFPGGLKERVQATESMVRRLHIVDTSKFIADVLSETDRGGSINSLLSD